MTDAQITELLAILERIAVALEFANPRVVRMLEIKAAEEEAAAAEAPIATGDTQPG
jgi:hypothetical protein